MAANKTARPAAAPRSTGFGESKRFIAPEGSYPEGIDRSKLTLGGQPIPEHLAALLHYDQTDQGKAARDAEIEAQGGRARTSIVRDPEDKKIDEYGGKLREGRLTIVQDPLALAMRGKVPVGHRGLWLSQKQCAEKGMLRGVLEYKPVLVLDEETGKYERVTCGGMFLASVPEEDAKAAEAHYKAINDERIQQATDKVREQSERIMAQDDQLSLAQRRRVSDSLAGLQIEDEGVADQELLEHEMTLPERG